MSLILDLIFVANGADIASRNLDKFSIAVLHPVVSRRTGVFGLWVLYNGVFFFLVQHLR